MKNLRKVLFTFTLVLVLGALTACTSSRNEALNNFEEAGYNIYEYKNFFAVNFKPENIDMDDYTDTSDVFRVADEMTIDLIENHDDLEVIENLDYQVYLLAFYEEVGDEIINKTAYMIDFPSVEYLDEVLEVSQTLQDYFAGKDREDYTNENLLLVVLSDYEEYYDEMVEIFHQED